MKTARHLWLDLEDTIITPVVNGWFNVQLMNIVKVRQVIKEFEPDYVHIFSFAIWDQAQLHSFNTLLRDHLERALGVEFSVVPTVDDDILPRCCKVAGIHRDTVSFLEMSDFWGKHEAFRLFMRSTYADMQPDVSVDVMLLDDSVINESFNWPDLRISGRIFNIEKPICLQPSSQPIWTPRTA
jgi:hypothetical protein